MSEKPKKIFEPRRCETCGAKDKASLHMTTDCSIWHRLPKDWLYFARNGEVITVCSPTCAQMYMEQIGIN